MKVLHFIYSLELGGGSEYIAKITRDLGDGFDHYVVGINGKNSDKIRCCENVKELNTANSLADLVCKFIRMVYLVRPDCIHLHGRGAGLIGRIILCFSKRRPIYTVHGFSLESLGILKKQVYLVCERLLYRCTKRIIFVSNDERDYFYTMTRIKRDARSVTIYNYLNEELSRWESNQSRKKIHALVIARLSYQKGIDLLLEALQGLDWDRFEIDIYGQGEDEKTYRDMAKTNLDNVHFLGAVSNASKHMHSYDVLIIPSRFEGMPYVMVEGVVSGIPIIATPARGIREFLDATNSYMAEAISPEGLRSVIDEYIRDFSQNPERINAKVIKYKKLIDNEFNYEKQIKKLKNVYLNVL